MARAHNLIIVAAVATIIVAVFTALADVRSISKTALKPFVCTVCDVAILSDHPRIGSPNNETAHSTIYRLSHTWHL